MKHRILFSCMTAAFALVSAGTFADDDRDRDNVRTATPIKHLVVIFQENISYDHYFATYPNALNLTGETPFRARRNTPANNNVVTPLDVNHGFKPIHGLDLVNNNPNANASAPAAPNNSRHNGTDAAAPFRLSPSQASTADQGHNDMPEQAAYNNGNMDGFPAWVGTAGTASSGPLPVTPPRSTKGLTMGYFDGNTVTALWNYAQHYAMSDNSFGTQFGPSSPGAINLIAGQTNGFSATLRVFTGSPPVTLLHNTHEAYGDASGTSGNLTMIGDADPLGDACSSTTGDQVTMAGQNIGDLLNLHNITWGWFEGGFNLGKTNSNGSMGCARFTVATTALSPASASTDYIPHHQPFQYYTSTSNPSHTRPSSVAAIGHSKIPNTNMPEPANHQYDTDDFFAALSAGNLPSVTFLKAPAFQDGHAGYSDPIDEQAFIVKSINAIQESKFWADTAIVILYDDSDGWYDHQMPPIVNPSSNPALDVLNTIGTCTVGLQQDRPTRTTPLNGNSGTPAWGRCGYGTRQPLLVISPFAKRNHIDHTLTDQTSVLKFIEDNWLSGQRIQPGGSFDTIAGTIEHMFDFDRKVDNDDNKLILDPTTGAVVFASHRDDDDDHDGDDHGRH